MEKEKLILIPGWAGSGDLWQHQSAYLQEIVDPEVITLYDQSSRQEMVDVVLQKAPETFYLAGQSMGGWVAQAVAAYAPHRVKKLMLINTWALPNPTLEIMQKKVMAELAEGRINDVIKENLELLLHPQRLDDKEFCAKVAQSLLKCPPEVMMRQMKAIGDDFSSEAMLSKIQAPTLVICSREDRLFPYDSQLIMASKIKGAECALIENCGHVSPVEQPQAVTALMRLFLSIE